MKRTGLIALVVFALVVLGVDGALAQGRSTGGKKVVVTQPVVTSSSTVTASEGTTAGAIRGRPITVARVEGSIVVALDPDGRQLRFKVAPEAAGSFRAGSTPVFDSVNASLLRGTMATQVLSVATGPGTLFFAQQQCSVLQATFDQVEAEAEANGEYAVHFDCAAKQYVGSNIWSCSCMPQF